MLRGALDAWLNPQLTAPALAPAGARRRDRFDAFTRRSRRVLQLAEDEARQRHSRAILPEHLLLGLLVERDGVAAHVLIQRGIRLEDVQATVREAIGTTGACDPQLIGLSADTKRAIELAVREANRLRHHYLGTEHLLLGLIAQGHGAGVELLRRHGAGDLDEIRRDVVRTLNEDGPRVR